MNTIQMVLTVALKKEIGTEYKHCPIVSYKQIIQNKSILSTYKSGVLILITGVGQENSKRAAEFIETYIKPLYVINLGTAGSTVHKPLSLFLIEEIQDTRGNTFFLDGRCPLPVQLDKETLYSSTRPCTKTNDVPNKYRLVDMESAAQAAIFKESNIHFSCIKLVSDRISNSTQIQFQSNLPKVQETLTSLLTSFKFKQPKVSVIIPVYNRSNQVQDAIASVVQQTYPLHECIVIDDGSTTPICLSDDLSADCVMNKDIIKVIRHKTNLGVSSARNTGIENATGDWIAFLDSDDEWHPNKIAKQVDYLQKNSFYKIIHSEEIWMRNGVRVNPCQHHKKPVAWAFTKSLERCLISPSSVIIHRDIFETIGTFDETLPACEDYDLWCRICRYFPVGLEPTQTMTRYAGHRDQLSTKYPAMDRFRIHTLDKLLKTEENTHFREQIQAVRKKKWDIYESGAKKRVNS